MRTLTTILLALLLAACGGGDNICDEPLGPPPGANYTPEQIQAHWDRWKAECR